MKKIFLTCITAMFFALSCTQQVNATESLTQEQSTTQEITSDTTTEQVNVPKVSTLSVKSRRKGMLAISWKKVSDADGVHLYIKKGSGNYKDYGEYEKSKKTETYYVIKLAAKKTYTVKAVAFKRIDGQIYYSKPVEKKIKISSKKVKVKGGDWKKGSVYGPSLSTVQLKKVKKKVESFLNGYIEPTMTDAMKVQIAHDYLCNNVSYASSWSTNYANTAYGALKYKKAQCSGYSRAMKALCDGMGIGCKYIHANNKSINPSHQFNMVRVNKKWYIVDVQCNDSSGFYAFFLCSSKTYKSSGIRWDESKYPKCKKDYFSS